MAADHSHAIVQRLTSSSKTPSTYTASAALREVASTTGSKRKPRVVLSLSTFPGRIAVANATFATLLEQTLPADAIYVNIPSEVKRLKFAGEVSKEEQDVLDFWGSKLTVRHPIDYGSSTKLIGGLLVEHDPDTIIITVDDDVRYSPELVSWIVGAMEKHPDHIVSGGCEFATVPEPRWQNFNGEGECKGWPLGYLGAGYRAGWFDLSIVDFSQVDPGCRLHDDVYLGGWVLRKQGKRVWKIDRSTILGHGAWTELSIHNVASTQESFQIPCLKEFNYLLD